MKFTKAVSKDTKYRRVKAVLAEAGYKCLRADEIPTSDIIVDEVAHHLRADDLVVIDTSGDSHSVSYEIGYCHGVGRTPETTLLLRAASEARIPFNYQHYRHRVYGTLGELEKEIRSFLGITAALPDSALARALTYELGHDAGQVSHELLEMCLLEAARRMELTAVSRHITKTGTWSSMLTIGMPARGLLAHR